MAVQSRSANVLERAEGARAASADPRTRALVRAVKARLEALYGPLLKRVILFGSRARGDFTEASDLDLAIVLEPPIGRRFQVKCEVIDATYDLFLDSGIIIQPWPICEDGLEEPDASPYPHLVREILREGIEV